MMQKQLAHSFRRLPVGKPKAVRPLGVGGDVFFFSGLTYKFR